MCKCKAMWSHLRLRSILLHDIVDGKCSKCQEHVRRRCLMLIHRSQTLSAQEEVKIDNRYGTIALYTYIAYCNLAIRITNKLANQLAHLLYILTSQTCTHLHFTSSNPIVHRLASHSHFHTYISHSQSQAFTVHYLCSIANSHVKCTLWFGSINIHCISTHTYAQTCTHELLMFTFKLQFHDLAICLT